MSGNDIKIDNADMLNLVKIGWRAGIVVLLGLAVVAGGLVVTLEGASADSLPNANTNTNENANEQKQEQKQENNQTVNVDVTQSTTAGGGQVEATKTATIAKTPETGVSVLSMATMFGILPFGIFLARYGKGRKLVVPNQINLASLGQAFADLRSRRIKRA